jgi:hypothetical protein
LLLLQLPVFTIIYKVIRSKFFLKKEKQEKKYNSLTAAAAFNKIKYRLSKNIFIILKQT